MISRSAIRKLVNAEGKRISASALDILEGHVKDVLQRAIRQHNGGRKTVDAEVMTFVIHGSGLKLKRGFE